MKPLKTLGFSVCLYYTVRALQCVDYAGIEYSRQIRDGANGVFDARYTEKSLSAHHAG